MLAFLYTNTPTHISYSYNICMYLRMHLFILCLVANILVRILTHVLHVRVRSGLHGEPAQLLSRWSTGRPF